MLVADIITRLSSRVGGFRSVEGALSLAEMMERKTLPQASPAAVVLPLDWVARPPVSGTGELRQNVVKAFGVVVIIRTRGGAGSEQTDDVETYLTQAVEALAGYSTATDRDTLALRRQGLVAMMPGCIIYQLEFILNDEIRITS